MEIRDAIISMKVIRLTKARIRPIHQVQAKDNPRAHHREVTGARHGRTMDGVTTANPAPAGKIGRVTQVLARRNSGYKIVNPTIQHHHNRSHHNLHSETIERHLSLHK